eukprot:g7906.t1 g7906   contig26:537450-538770(-)
MLIPSRAARPFLARCTTTAMASSPKATASMSLRPWNQTLINNTHHHYGNTLLIKREIGMNIWGRSKRRSNTASRARGKRRNKRVRAGENPLLVGVSRDEMSRFSIKRFLNPWDDLTLIVQNEDILYDKVESTTRTFGVVAALMGSLAAALLTFQPYDGYDTNREQLKRTRTIKFNNRTERNNDKEGEDQQPFTPIQRRNTLGFVEHVTFTHHLSGTSLLVFWGIEKKYLDDIYTACCAGSFYSGVFATVLSSILNAWMAATPPGAVRTFVRAHSWAIVAMPALLATSTGLAGTALFIGLDREHGTPVSYVGLGGTVIGGCVLGLVTGSGWVGTYRAVTNAVLKRNGKL